MDAILVACAQNSFLSKNGPVYMGDKAEILKVRLVDYLSSFSGTRIFLREKHTAGDSFFICDKTHSITASDDFQVCEELRKYADYCSDSIRYNAFFETTLDLMLRQKKINRVWLVGVETHTSILFTAEELRNRGYDVVLVEPCTMARDDYLHGFAISLMFHHLAVKVTNG